MLAEPTVGAPALAGRLAQPLPLPLHAEMRAATHFASLDVLRAIAILAVVWHHTAQNAFDATLSHKGYHGVTLFFAISGFLIVTLLLREKSRSGSIEIGAFMVKRALRILPLYYATLLAYVLVVAFLERDPMVRDRFFATLPAFATFTSNWVAHLDGGRVVFYFAWSLAAEEQFYLVWPWIERARLGQHFGLFIAAVAVALSPDFLGQVWADGEPKPALMFALSRLPGAIGLGVVLAHALHNASMFGWLAPLIGRRGSALFISVLLVAVLALDGALGRLEPAAVDVLCMLLVGATVIRPDNDLAVLTRVPGVVHIGVVSYGLYLLHMLAASAVKLVGKPIGLASGVPLFLATVLVALAVASLSHATFERAMFNFRKRLLAR